MEEMLWYKYKWPKKVRKTLQYPDEPLFAVLDKAAEQAGNKPYTIFMGPTQTFAKVRDSANRIANFLASKGIKKGDRVAIFLPNLPHYPPIFFGILKAGAVVVTCNPQYKAPELHHQLKDSGAKAVFCFDHPHFTPECYEAVKDTKVEFVVVCSVKPFLPGAKAAIGGLLGKIPKSPYYEKDITVTYQDVLKSDPTPPKVKINPTEDLALVIYTGGTTGTPKGAMLTHRNLYANLLQFNEWVWLDPPGGGEPQPLSIGNEVYIGALPWYHSYGLTLTMLASLYHQSKVVCIADPRAGKPPLSDLLAAIQKHKGTILHAVPTLYAGIIFHPNVRKYNLRSIKACGSGAAPLSPAIAKAFEEVTGATLFEGYGLSETSPLTHANPSNVRDRKFGSIGFPISDTISKIVDLETGKKELKVGEDGEIAINGPQVMKGYWNKPKETEDVFRTIGGKRYFLTGDIGHMDKEGYFIVTDRKKDMINVSGLKAYPREIEDALVEHPKIAMAAVVGIPRVEDPTNEYVKAFVVLKPGQTTTPDEIIAWCKDRMAGYKRPKEVEIRASLPQTAVGKVLRRELRDEELAKRQKKK
jgi:long-chain acyl-CoA synthetase